MAFRFPPATTDGRAHNPEAVALARRNSAQAQTYQQLLQQQQQQQQQTEDSSIATNSAGAYMRNNGPGEASKEAANQPATLPALVEAQQQRRNVVFPDPIAFRYLEEDDAVSVVRRNAVLPGYELYLVEQWACSRLSPTLVIVTYTGDDKSSIIAGVLSVPTDREAWSPKLRVYFKALEQHHARPKDTPLGELMITNLSSFPSALTVIPVPNGDIRQNRLSFIVNEDLKRLGCSGRAGMTLTDPSNATQSKFYQLYKVNERIPFAEAVIELIKLCQVSLLFFGKLEHEYIDGLLCDKTETAINNWWAEVGSEYYNIEPTDGILGPTTVAALLGTLMGARNRLAWCSAPVMKDVFDIDATKRGIGVFQKAHKLERTRRLDRQTLLKLHTVTAKAAAGETWGVQKAVKSTVAEIGGKRGELVIGMVGGRDKGGISDIETLDIEKFIGLASGERAKWLWYGKPRRTGSTTGMGIDAQDKASPTAGENPFNNEITPVKSGKKAVTLPLDDVGEARVKEQSPNLLPAAPRGINVSSGSGTGTGGLESPSSADRKRTVFKSVAGRMSDARSGFGRIKDAMGGGLRGHGAKPSRDELFGSAPEPGTGMASPVIGRAFSWKQKPEEYLAAMRKGEVDSFTGAPQPTCPAQGQNQQQQCPPCAAPPVPGTASGAESSQKSLVLDLKPPPAPSTGAAEIRRDLVSNPPSVAGSAVGEKDLRGPILDQEQGLYNVLASLHRRHSISTPSPSVMHMRGPNEARWPRRMSFGDAAEAVLSWEGINDPVILIERENSPSEDKGPNTGGKDGDEDGRKRESTSLDPAATKELYAAITQAKENVEPWVLSKISLVDSLDAAFGKSQDQLQSQYYQLLEAYQRAREESQELVAEQRTQTTEGVKDVEVLIARLEYEIDSLISKVHDVEEGVVQFEREVEEVEKRAEELKKQLETESWLHWLVRTLTGIGTGPNITRSTGT